MALKQTRRGVSLNRAIHEAATAEAERRSMTLAHFIESLIRSAVPELPPTEHVPVERAQKARNALRLRHIANAAARVIPSLVVPLDTASVKRVRAPKPKHVPIVASRTGTDPIDRALADAGGIANLESLTLVEREHRKRKRSRKLVRILRERGLLTPENEGYASPDSWSAK